MEVCFSHNTALALTRRQPFERAITDGVSCTMELPVSLPSKVRFNDLLVKCGFPEDVCSVHVLVSSHNGKRHNKSCNVHVCKLDLPLCSLVEIGSGVCFSAPPLLLVQMAQRLSWLELTVLVGELCGLYTIDGTHDLGLVQRKKPVTSVSMLKRSVEQFFGFPGVKRARRALQYAFNNSGSPMETTLNLLMGLPTKLGGYSLPVIAMNSNVEVASVIDGFSRMRIRKPDLILRFPKHAGNSAGGIAIDYNGSVHTGLERIYADAKRTNELLAAGFKPYVLTKSQFKNLAYMDWFVEQLRKDLGVKRHSKSRTDAQYRNHVALHRELMCINTRLAQWGT